MTPWACRISFLSLFSLLGTWCSLWLLGSLPCCFVIFSVVDSQILPAVVIMGVLHCSYLVFFLTIVWCSLLFSCALRCSLLLECPLMLLGIFHCCCWVLSFVVVQPLLLSLIAQWSPLLLNIWYFSLASEPCLLTHVKYLFCDFIHHNVGNVFGFIHHYIIIVEITKFVSNMLRPIALGKSMFYNFGCCLVLFLLLLTSALYCY